MRLLLLWLALFTVTIAPVASSEAASPLPGGPVVRNSGMECSDDYLDQAGIRGMVPGGWIGKALDGSPHMGSTQMWVTYGCKAEENLLEKIEGYDSFVVKADEVVPGRDFEAPPFDLALYQQVAVTPGADYSLSAWMVSFCGGTAVPTSCPDGYYISKMAALDPKGGQDPQSASLAWVEDRRPHVEARWVDLMTAATATAGNMTIFLRMKSPFLHRGNYGHMDAVKLVRSPNARFASTAAQGRTITVAWNGDLGPDIPLIPASTHQLSFEVQVRRNAGGWQPWRSGVAAGSATLTAAGSCRNEEYRFRIRAWAIQPQGPGSWPPHQFAGVWRESAAVSMPKTAACQHRAYLPFGVR